MKTKSPISISLLLLGWLVTGSVCPAAIITWTNTSNGNWSVTNNWSPNRAPSTNDITVITNAGTYTVTLNANPTIAGLIVGGSSGTQTLATAGRILTLNGEGVVNTNGSFLLSGGSVSGTNQMTLAGAMTWQYGSIDTNAAVTVTADGRVTMASDGNHAKLLYGNLTNAGVVTWQPLGSFNIVGTLHNQGLFEAQVAGTSILKWGSNAVIVNDGVFRKSTGSGDINCYVPFINSGTVDVQIGILILFDGSVLHSGCTFTGAGATRLNTGVHALNGEVHSENLVLNGAALEGNGTLSGTVTWVYGQISEAASLTVATNGALLLSSANNFTKFVYGNLTNAGTITWQPTGYLSIGGTLHNLPGALFDAQVDNISILKSNTNAHIINDGVFRKSAASYTVSCAVPIINNGTVEIFPGTLQFDGGCTNSIGTILLAGGTFRTAQPFCLSGGLLTGWGSVATDVTNAATIRPARSNGVLTINGRYEQLLGGRMEFEIAGNLPGTNQSRLNITGAAKLRGNIGVCWSDGYLPEPGKNFPVMTFASHSGEFCCFDNFLLLDQGRRLTPVYTSTSLTLATAAAPEPTNVPLRVAVDGGALVCWPVEFSGYELYWKTNLSVTNWTLLPGVTNRFLESLPLARKKFFRLHKP